MNLLIFFALLLFYLNISSYLYAKSPEKKIFRSFVSFHSFHCFLLWAETKMHSRSMQHQAPLIQSYNIIAEKFHFSGWFNDISVVFLRLNTEHGRQHQTGKVENVIYLGAHCGNRLVNFIYANDDENQTPRSISKAIWCTPSSSNLRMIIDKLCIAISFIFGFSPVYVCYVGSRRHCHSNPNQFCVLSIWSIDWWFGSRQAL